MGGSESTTWQPKTHASSSSCSTVYTIQTLPLASLEGDVAGNHWGALRDILQAYRCITKVTVGDGRSTSFWWDAWSEGAPLAECFPCLLSHCTNMEASVHLVCSTGLNSILVPRLSLQAAQEKIDADSLTAFISLRQQQDERNSFFAAVGNRLDTGQLYRASTQSG